MSVKLMLSNKAELKANRYDRLKLFDITSRTYIQLLSLF